MSEPFYLDLARAHGAALEAAAPSYDVEAGLAKLLAWAREDIPDHLHGAPGAELADLAGPELCGAAADIAEALECDRGHDPMEVTRVAAGLEDEPSLIIQAVTAAGLAVEITVRVTGREKPPGLPGNLEG